MEFGGGVFKEVLQRLGAEGLIHPPPYRPQSNGRIEGFRRCLEACIARHVHAGLEWDGVAAMATAACGYFPNMSAKESAFFLMCGGDPLSGLSAILDAPRGCLGDATGFPGLEALKGVCRMVAQRLMNSGERCVRSNRCSGIPDHGVLVGDLVLVKDRTAGSFEPGCREDFQVVQVCGTSALRVSDGRGRLHNVHITDIEGVNMTEKIASQLKEACNGGGGMARHLVPWGRIPGLGWNMDRQGKKGQNPPNTAPEAPVTQDTPQRAEGPPGSRLHSKTKIMTPSSLMDPPKCNAQSVDHHKLLTQVNQVHTVHGAGFGWQTVVALTIIVDLMITLFLCFRM